MKRILLLALVLISVCLCFASCSCHNGEDVKYATVKFDSHIDGVQISSQKIEIGSMASAPQVTLTRDGYSFLGWYDGDKKWDFTKNAVEKDITLSAKWDSYLSYTAVSEIESTNIKNLVGASNQDGVIVTGCDFNVEEVVIPTTYNGKRVVGINWAFAGRTKIKSVVIPDGVVFISTNSFNRCDGLEQIVIPKSVMVIERGAFFLCSSLKTINCRADSKPAKWDSDFNLKSSDTGKAPEHYAVVYGYTGE